MIDPHFEIAREQLHDKSFVWSCILRFRDFSNYGIWRCNLIIMWKDDYDKLIKNQKLIDYTK